MGENAKKQAHRGADVQIRLYKAGAPLDIIEAENIQYLPIIKVIESEPLSVGQTVRDTHADGCQVTVTAVKKGNGLLAELLAQVSRNRKTGAAFEKYTVLLKYRDINGQTVRNVKIVDATITELDPVNSGGNFEKSTEGFTIIGTDSE